jgi:hypothetical protein
MAGTMDYLLNEGLDAFPGDVLSPAAKDILITKGVGGHFSATSTRHNFFKRSRLISGYMPHLIVAGSSGFGFHSRNDCSIHTPSLRGRDPGAQ